MANAEKIRELVAKAKSENVITIIAGAGLAAHLPGFIASQTDIPVLGVPLPVSQSAGWIPFYLLSRCRPECRALVSVSAFTVPRTRRYSRRVCSGN